MTDEISQYELGAPEDPLAQAMDAGSRVAPDPRFRAELRERLTAVAVPPPAAGSGGAEIQPWMPLIALTVGAIALGIFVAGRSTAPDSAPPPAPTGLVPSSVRPVHTAVPDSRDASAKLASPLVEKSVDVAPTDTAVEPPPQMAVPVVGPTEAGPIDVATLPSADASPTEEEEEEADATSQPSPSPTALLDPESPPTAVATSTPGPTSRPRPTATPVAPTPGVPGG